MQPDEIQTMDAESYRIAASILIEELNLPVGPFYRSYSCEAITEANYPDHYELKKFYAEYFKPDNIPMCESWFGSTFKEESAHHRIFSLLFTADILEELQNSTEEDLSPIKL
jgi:hypothetical protein